MTVIFDIPEKFKKVRDGLRLKLEELSFGMLQKSVWISPYHFEEDLKEFLENNRLGSYVLVLTTKKLYSDDPRKLAENVWNLKKINMGYSKLLGKLNQLERKTSGNVKRDLKRIIYKYLTLLESDPLLPMELLPNSWKREKVLKKLKDYS